LEELEESGETGSRDAESATPVEPLDERPAAAEETAAGEASPIEAGELEELEKLDELEELEEPEELEELEEGAGDEGAVPAAITEAAPEEPGELEELEELEGEPEELEEEPAELEELEEETVGKSPAGSPPMTGAQIDEIAREIEFADSPQEEESGEDVTMDLDIASPFDLMTFEPDGKNDELSADPGLDTDASSPVNTEGEKKNSPRILKDDGEEELEELPAVSETGLEELDGQGGLPYIYRPFCLSGFQNLALLKVLPDDSPVPAAKVPVNQGSSAGARVIEEREGLHYISSDAFKADRKIEQGLNREFKDLVDSVLGEKAGPARGPDGLGAKDP
jgi:hypothetical protein